MTTIARTSRGQRRVWGFGRIAALLLACLALAAGLSLVSMRAYGAWFAITGAQGTDLQLQSDSASAQFLNMSPGSVERWQIQAQTTRPSGTLNVQFWNDNGALITQPVDGLQLQVQRCDAEWTNITTTPTCSANQANVFGPAAASTMAIGPTTDLDGIVQGTGKFLLVTMSIPNTPQAQADKSLQGLTANIGFGLTAAGSDPTTPPPSTSLAFTGADALPLALLAAGALGLGIVVTGARRIRSTNAERSAS